MDFLIITIGVLLILLPIGVAISAAVNRFFYQTDVLGVFLVVWGLVFGAIVFITFGIKLIGLSGW